MLMMVANDSMCIFIAVCYGDS